MSEKEQHEDSRRPVFIPDEPVAERLVKMVTSLVTELAVLRERIDTLERLITEKGVLQADAVEAFRPDAEVEEARRQWREKYLGRVFGDLQTEVREALGAIADESETR